MNPPTTAPAPAVYDQSRDSFAGLKSTDRAAREEIQHRAYAIWLREGRPENRQAEHWQQAETEVMAQRKH